jgi:hypothetical protein
MSVSRLARREVGHEAQLVVAYGVLNVLRTV